MVATTTAQYAAAPHYAAAPQHYAHAPVVAKGKKVI